MKYLNGKIINKRLTFFIAMEACTVKLPNGLGGSSFITNQPVAIFFDAKKTAAKETVAVGNFINLQRRFGNDLKLVPDLLSGLQTINHSDPPLCFE